MKRIEIINGVYGARDSKTKRVSPVPAGGTVTVSDEEAARLVRLKVAKYSGEETSADGVATPSAPAPGDGTGENTPDATGGAEGRENGDEDILDIVDGHYTVESLMKLERKDMEAFAADLGIDANAVKRCRNKTEVAELIAGVEAAAGEDGEDEDPPALGVENPVV